MFPSVMAQGINLALRGCSCLASSTWTSDKILRVMTSEPNTTCDAMHQQARQTFGVPTSSMRSLLLTVILLLAASMASACESEMVCPNGTDGSPCVPTEDLGQAPDLPSEAMNETDSSTSTGDAFADTSGWVVEEHREHFSRQLWRAESLVSAVRLPGRDPPETDRLVTYSTPRFLTLYRRAGFSKDLASDVTLSPIFGDNAARNGVVRGSTYHGPRVQEPTGLSLRRRVC